MTKHEYTERQKFTTIIARESALPAHHAEHSASLLLRHGKTYARLQEMSCNGVGTWYGESAASFGKRQERFERALEKKESQIEARIRAIVGELGAGFGVLFQGDPRGSTVKITVPSGYTNDWGREGICVPSA